MSEVGSDVRWEAEVYQNDWPCRQVSLVEDGETIEGQTKSNITVVFKVLVIEGLAINLNKLPTEITVELSIEYVRYSVIRMIVGGATCSIVQQLDDVLVEKHCLKS